MAYTFGQLQTLWINAGGNKALAPLMAAIALAESSGQANAYNPAPCGPGSHAEGLWQICMPENAGYVPGGNANDPASNAKAAVSIYKAQGLGAWASYPQPALTILGQHGGQPPASVPPDGQQGQGSGTSAGGVQLTSFWGSLGKDLNPASWVSSFWKDLTSPVRAGIGIADAVAAVAKDFEALVKAFGEILNAVEWFFHPSHWIRIFLFAFGVGALLPGLYALMRTGSAQAGDLTLAMGILLVTFAGILLFLAFHNLPDDVKDFAGLIGWITRSIQQGSPA